LPQQTWRRTRSRGTPVIDRLIASTTRSTKPRKSASGRSL